MFRSSKWWTFFKFSDYNFVCMFHFSCCIPYQFILLALITVIIFGEGNKLRSVLNSPSLVCSYAWNKVRTAGWILMKFDSFEFYEKNVKPYQLIFGSVMFDDFTCFSCISC
jgi:hypothetical protein